MKRRDSQIDRLKETSECGQGTEVSQKTEDLSRMDGIVRSLVRFVEPFVQLAAVGGVYGR